MPTIGFATRAAAVAAVLVGCVLLYLHFSTPAPVTHEQAAPAIIQSDGSTVLERKESAPAKTVVTKAKLPKGASLERQVDVTVKPDIPGDTAKVEVNLVKMKDDTRRVVVYSDNAEVGGIDVPVELNLEPKHTWAVGMYVDPMHRETAGIFIDKDVGRVRLGAEVGRGRNNSAEVRLKVGVTF